MISIDKKALRKAYRQVQREAGVFQIRNTTNGKVLLGSSLNLHGPFNRLRFTLNFGSHGCAELQRDWNELGEDAFAFEVLVNLGPQPEGQSAYERSLELQLHEEEWLDRLRPYGERGYNQEGERIRQA